MKRKGLSPLNHATTTNRSVVRVALVEENDLAMDRLISILEKDRSIHWMKTDDLMQSDLADGAAYIFIIDLCRLIPPISVWIKQLKRLNKNARYVILGKDAQRADLLALGIDGYVTYHQVAASLVNAIHAVADGKLWIDQDALRCYVKETIRELRTRESTQPAFSITRREDEILQFVRQRFSNKEIARHLSITENTVKFHLSNLFSKLHITRRTQLFADEAFSAIRFSAIPPVQDELPERGVTGKVQFSNTHNNVTVSSDPILVKSSPFRQRKPFSAKTVSSECTFGPLRRSSSEY